MTRTATPIETVNASEARQRFSELVNRVHNSGVRVLIEKNGAAVAYLVSRSDLQCSRYLDEHSRVANDAIDCLKMQFEGIPEDELEREIEKAIADVRAERHAANDRALMDAK